MLKDMKEGEFVQTLKAVFDDVYLPALNEHIDREVDAKVRSVVYREMQAEIEHAIRAQVGKAVRDAVSVSVRVANVNLPAGV